MSAGHVPHTEGQISQNARFQCREFKVRDLTIKAFVRNPDVQMECDREHFDFFWDSDIVGQVIWEPSFILAEYVMDNRQSISGKRVIELGSGVALPSIIASSFADVSVASDNNASALALAETAWSLNAEALSQEQHNFQTKFIDWRKPVDEALRGSFDYVLAADVIYTTGTARPFLATAVSLLAEGTSPQVILLHEQRRAISADGGTENFDSSLQATLDLCSEFGLQYQQVPLSCFLAPGYTTTLPPERMADIACYIFEREG
uniref:Calmodulin-lysine N-methyltransferase n=1 Tax=Eutreptiella gymnastica TaxID=73025 RepID=A0A7S4C901_9EUGL